MKGDIFSSNRRTVSIQVIPVEVDDNMAESDVEAQATTTSVSAKSRKITFSRLFCDKFSNIDVAVIFTYGTIVVAAICAMLAPIFIEVTHFQ